MKHKDTKDFKAPFQIDLHPPDGPQVTCVCDKERFHNAELLDGKHQMLGMYWKRMSGWSILKALVPIILYHRPYCIIEIGAGMSTYALAEAAEAAGVVLHSVDKSPRKNVKLFHDHYFHQVFSEEFMEEFEGWGENPAIVFIDADHHYEAAKTEFYFFFERLVPGGVIFLHDTMPPHEAHLRGDACGDVYKLRQELEKRDDLDCFTWPYTADFAGLTMVIKHYKDRGYWEK
ncbi:class I SAM-dependent methyltransferase [Candidatus Pacearchaeota archaeon]|nr:class I SAM-dependent methyltransferase [Candidatus Pacearchaeota archaeon]